MADKDTKLEYKAIPFTGRWRPAEDGTKMSEGDFQTLTNMRYTDTGIKSVRGMGVINSSAISDTYVRPTAGFHFRKDQPSESHVLVQQFNAGLTQSYVYDNTTAIPSQGDFTATAVHNDTASASPGAFCSAPDGAVAYCNEKDTSVWTGSEGRLGSFVIGDLVGTVKVDYSKVINNTLSDSSNVATMVRTSTGTADANTMLLLHLENNVTDSSPTTAHTVTNNNVTFSSSIYKVGSYSALFNGTSAYLTIPDNDDFDFSGGTWTIDFWMYMTPQANRTIYYQGTDSTHYFKIYISGGSAPLYNGTLKVDIVNTSTVVQLQSTTMFNSSWYHVAVVESGNSYYLFINGSLVHSVSDTDRAQNYSGSVYIGSTSTPDCYFEGYIDEFRISSSARWTSNFTPDTTPYGSTTYSCYAYLGCLRPIKGAKFYIGTANATAATVTAKYWDGSSFTTVSSQVDGTSASSKTLAQTGSITFDSTVSTAKLKYFNGQLLYWYLFEFAETDATTTVYYITVDAPFQSIKDIWDGSPRQIAVAKKYSSGYQDISSNVLTSDPYDPDDSTTYANLNAAAAAVYLLVGFTERMTGLKFTMGGTNVNSNASTMTIYYWDGESWTSVSNLSDATTTTGATFNKDGVCTWKDPTEIEEFQTQAGDDQPLYYYKVMWSATLSAAVHIDRIYGIPAAKTIRGYKFPVMWKNRLGLGCESSYRKNMLLLSSESTNCVFNGDNSTELYFGDETELMAGGAIFSRYGSDLYENLLILKRNEIYLVDGSIPDDFKIYRIGEGHGCVAPQTLVICNLGYEIAPGINKQVAVWQSATGIMLFDGASLIDISTDISNFFDKDKSECINATYIHKSSAFYDERKREYHWLFTSGSGTSHNYELVFDLMRKKWFRIDRETGYYLQIGFPVIDTNGDKYTYGMYSITAGKVVRLEYGMSFEPDEVFTRTWKTGDYPLSGWMHETNVRKVKQLAVATSQNKSVTISHFGDCITTSGESTESMSLYSITHRVKQVTNSVNWRSATFHSFQGVVTSATGSGETLTWVPYEPIGLGIFYQTIREDVR
uniref:Putative baseplate wedge initiator n=1 Tax=viral metagenome TaxID=1070528 RepID=A0A6H1ZA87_9ZZZZ